MKNPTNTGNALAGHSTQNSKAIISEIRASFQHLTSIINGLTLVMLATVATLGGCSHV